MLIIFIYGIMLGLFLIIRSEWCPILLGLGIACIIVFGFGMLFHYHSWIARNRNNKPRWFWRFLYRISSRNRNKKS